MHIDAPYQYLLIDLCFPSCNLFLGKKITQPFSEFDVEFKNKMEEQSDQQLLQYLDMVAASTNREEGNEKTYVDKAIRYLISDPVFLNLSTHYGTPLCQAIRNQKIEYAKKLISMGADLNAASFKTSVNCRINCVTGIYLTALRQTLCLPPQKRQELIQLMVLKGAKIGHCLTLSKKKIICAAIEDLYQEFFKKLCTVQASLLCLNKDSICCITRQYLLSKVEMLAKPCGSGYDI